MANDSIKYIDHITVPPEAEGEETKNYEIADYTWRTSAARKIQFADLLRWNSKFNDDYFLKKDLLGEKTGIGVARLNEGKIEKEFLPSIDKNDLPTIETTDLPNSVNDTLNDYTTNKSNFLSSIKTIRVGNSSFSATENNHDVYITAEGMSVSLNTEDNKNTINFVVDSIDFPINHLADGEAEGSLLGTGATEEEIQNQQGYHLGEYAVALGVNTKAIGTAAFAEGSSTTASGAQSHAGGSGTVAQRKSQTTIGEFNTLDSSGTENTRGKYIFIIGNGTDSTNRSNALAVDWSGNVEITGNVAISGTPTANNHAVTKQYVDNKTFDASKITSGKISSDRLPSYVDDVVEYNTKDVFPAAAQAQSGKIYVAKDTNKTYRWSGTQYVEISESLALGTTSATAFRGDYGETAYTHAVTNKGAAFSSGLYKITTNSEGHVTAAAAVTKNDITGLGIPGSLSGYATENYVQDYIKKGSTTIAAGSTSINETKSVTVNLYSVYAYEINSSNVKKQVLIDSSTSADGKIITFSRTATDTTNPIYINYLYV